MSTRRARKPSKSKYIKVQDTENTIYESDDSSIEILPERDRSKAIRSTKNSNSDRSVQTKESDSTPQNPEVGEEELVFPESDYQTEELATGETEDAKGPGRKRNSLVQSTSITIPKKVKTDSNKTMSDAPVQKPLEIELQLERNRVPFKRRSINEIIEELDTITRKLKEGYEKCERPTYWGTPIVKQSSEKWDPNHIPEKLLEIYEKRFDVGQQSVSSSLSEKASESQNEYKLAESKPSQSCTEVLGEEALEDTEYDDLKGTGNEAASGSNTQGKMILRPRNQNRTSYDDIITSEIGDDDLEMDKQHSKKYSSKCDDKNSSDSKEKIISDLDSQYYDEDSIDPHGTFEKLKIDDSGPSTSMGAAASHLEDKAIALPLRVMEEDQVACPICGKHFEKNRIESHANHCATETFRD